MWGNRALTVCVEGRQCEMYHPYVYKCSVLLWVLVSKNHPLGAIQPDGFLALSLVSWENSNERPAHFKDFSVLPIGKQIFNRHVF